MACQTREASVGVTESFEIQGSALQKGSHAVGMAALARLMGKVCVVELSFLPSAQLTSLKLLSISIFAVFLILSINGRMRSSAFVRASLLLTSYFSVLMLWALLALMYGYDAFYALRAFASYFSVAVVFWLLYIADIEKILPFRSVVKIFVVSMAAYIIAKAIIMFLPFFGLASARDVHDFLGGSITTEFRSEDALLLRLTPGNDVLIPFALYLSLKAESGFKDKLRGGIAVILLAGAFLSFTRFVWAMSIVALLASFSFRKIAAMAILFALVLFVLDYSTEHAISDEVYTRLFDIASVNKKAEQARLFIEYIGDRPLLGYGCGAFMRDYIRSEYLPFQYETQWISLVFQFGFLGVILIVFFAFLPIRKILLLANRLRLRKGLAEVVIMYLLYLSGAFTNPYLFILNLGILYYLVDRQASAAYLGLK